MGLRKRVRMEDCFEGPHLGNHETQLQTLKWRTHEQAEAITCMGLRKRIRMEDCLEGPHLGNHETQLQTRKWRTHERKRNSWAPKKGENGGLP